MYVVLAFLAALYVIPFIWLVSGSLKTSTELFAVPTQWFPAVAQWSNYYNAVNAFPFMLYMRNTLIIVTCNVVGSLVSNSLVAYSFAKIEWKGRDTCFLLVLMTMILPFQVIMIPQFLLFQKMRWVGTFLPLTVPCFLGNAFFIFLLRQFFVTIPNEIAESARMDGANEFIIFYRLCLPLARPALTTVAVFAFLNAWNDYMGPLLFLSRDNLYTLSIGVRQIMSNNDPRWTLLMAIGVLMTLPVLIIFFLLQKYFIQGISFSGIKG